MKKIISLFLLMIFYVTSLFSDDSLHYEITAQLLVKDREKTSINLSDWAVQQGGYFTIRSLDRLTLRVPATSLKQLKEHLERDADEILDYSQNAFDMRENILMSQSYLQAREELLARNMEYLDKSDFQGTLTLELEIRRLMQEIDSLKGILRKYENDTKYARVDLNISFKNQSLPEGRDSRFDWINELNFFSFINSPAQLPGGLRRGPSLPVPEGFALSDRKPWFQIVSPEAVRLRLKEMENYPVQKVEFWEKALFNHMEGLGYIPLNSGLDLSLDDEDSFKITSWGVPLGQKDFIYITGLRLNKSKLEILEIAGEAEYVRTYF